MCLGHVFFILSHQVLKEKARCSPSKTPYSHLTVTNPQQSWGLLNIFIPSHHVMVVGWVFFLVSDVCVSTSYFMCCANPLQTNHIPYRFSS